MPVGDRRCSKGNPPWPQGKPPPHVEQWWQAPDGAHGAEQCVVLPAVLTCWQACKAKSSAVKPVEGYLPWRSVQFSWMYLRKAGLRIST